MWKNVNEELPSEGNVFMVSFRQDNMRKYTFSWFNIKTNLWGFRGRFINDNIDIDYWYQF